MNSEYDLDIACTGPRYSPGLDWEHELHDGLDWWRALLVGRYPATVVRLPAAESEHFFVVIFDGELMDGPDPACPFLFDSIEDAMAAAEQHAQACLSTRGQSEPRYQGAYGNLYDPRDHDPVVEKWLRALTRS